MRIAKEKYFNELINTLYLSMNINKYENSLNAYIFITSMCLL